MNTDVFLEEYEAQENVVKYVSRSAGTGIAFVLENVYGPVYDDLLTKLGSQAAKHGGFRVLEYGCGGGMNLLWIVNRILKRGLPLEMACGTDFANSMVEASYKEAAETLKGADLKKVCFYPVANENLGKELPPALGQPAEAVMGSFDLTVGVNTYRYCFRLGKQAEAAQALFSLTQPGGYSVMIEMNSRFPLFRSKRRNRNMPKMETHLPSLEDYRAVFQQAGFEIVTAKNFCWVPHSAGKAMTTMLRICTPVLNLLFSRFATRSLIVARKPV